MSSPIASVLSSSAAMSEGTSDARGEKLKKAAMEFESLLVKQMLQQSKIAGDEKANGYSDMAVDAMTSAVEKGGGLGLARRIEEAIGHQGSAMPHLTQPLPKA